MHYRDCLTLLISEPLDNFSSHFSRKLVMLSHCGITGNSSVFVQVNGTDGRRSVLKLLLSLAFVVVALN